MCSYKNVIAVTNRKLCKGNYLDKLVQIAKLHPNAIILREKDLSDYEYQVLAKQVVDICSYYKTKLILHGHINASKKLNHDMIHLPLHIFRQLGSDKQYFSEIGVSVHSPWEAQEAQNLGASYIIAGHVFETDCKHGVVPKGLNFLEEVVKSVDIPVYAIGGITEENMQSVLDKGAQAVCMMSQFMK